MQQPPQMIPVMPSFPPTNITTEQIQKISGSIASVELKGLQGRMTEPSLHAHGGGIVEMTFASLLRIFFQIMGMGWLYLDENKKLILAILDNQNLGKLTECAHYQAQLQKNLMYLAAIADAQPQAPTMPPQMAPHPAMQASGYYMQHPQAAAMAQQQGIFPQKMPLQFNNPHQLQDPQQQLHQHQAMQAQMGMRPGATNNGMHPMHAESSLGGGSSGGPPSASGPGDIRGGNKQDASEAGTTGADGQGSSAGGHGGDGEEAK
ncbi:GRF1-interacting factor 3 [Citrus sinensis]|uniref:GRF1-interacting factor 3 n=1 Tax=Citrus sinensis TaxID=2711 RepID=A0ACB8MP12_CITSI|nr:GRF1-interacting factor 3 [Citrus sinensis]KAH9787317.1 GRF1-interacting factor 3 [Citrus sinensis]